MPRIYDLSQTVAPGMSIFPGDPEPSITPWPGEPPWHISHLSLGTHTGTHLDAPAHLGRGPAMADLPIDRFLGRGVVLDAGGRAAGAEIGPEILQGAQLRAGQWVIVRTGWSRYFGTPAYLNHPALAPSLAGELVDRGIALLGVDLPSPEQSATGSSVIHQILLGTGTLIVENLAALDQLVAGREYAFAMLPLKLAAPDGAPVRAVAWEV